MVTLTGRRHPRHETRQCSGTEPVECEHFDGTRGPQGTKILSRLQWSPWGAMPTPQNRPVLQVLGLRHLQHLIIYLEAIAR